MYATESMAVEIDLTDPTATKRLNRWFDQGWQYDDGWRTPSNTVLMILTKSPDDDDDDDDDYDDPYTR